MLVIARAFHSGGSHRSSTATLLKPPARRSIRDGQAHAPQADHLLPSPSKQDNTTMESYLKTQKFSGAEIVDLTGDHDISKSCFRISKELPTKLTTKFEIIEDDDDIKPSTASYHMSAEDVIQDEPIGRRYIRPLRPARHSMLHEETERDIPVFYIEDDEENEDDDDKIRELSPGEVEDLRTTLAHRSGSAHPTTGFGREDSVLRPFGIVVVPGMRVELQDGDFLAIKQLVRGKYGEAKVKGILLRRTRRIDNTLPKKYNELCAIIKASAENTGDPALDDYLVTREVSEIVAEREIIFTNQPFPACSWRVKDKMYRNEDELMEAAELVCRWKHVEFCNMIERGVSAKCWVRLREAESDAGMGLADIELMRAWHGDGDERVPASFKIRTTASTSHKTRTNPTNESLGARIDLTNGDSDSEIEEITEISTQTFVKRVNRQGVYERQSSSTTTERFTTGGTQSMSSKKSSPTSSTSRGISYGDICCGAGGATRAAERAGLNVMFVVDHDSDSCKTQRKNFAQAKVLKIDIFDFCTSTDRPWMRVTVLHISFPCQYYSAAHTINGQNDEKNVAAGYSVIPILKRCRPRVVTLEQTSNMVNGHPESFQALIQQFTECGYSVRAKIVNFADHGNVQPRKRLFIIAAW